MHRADAPDAGAANPAIYPFLSATTNCLGYGPTPIDNPLEEVRKAGLDKL